jgi:hypothetical protein
MRPTVPWLAVFCLLPSLAALAGQAVPPGGLPVNPAPAAPPAPAGPAPAAPEQDDETLLKAAKVGVDGPGLLEYFRRHTTAAAQRERIGGLIRQLGDDSFKVRQKASDDLAALGAAAAPYLRRALDDPDEEARQRAAILVKSADGADARAAEAAAAARLLRQRAPADAAPVLLAYTADADGVAVEEEVVASLAVLGVHDGKVDAAVLAALKDKDSAARAAAAAVVGRSGTPEQRADVQALLNDPDPRVRFGAARGLAAGRDRAGVSVLVALVKDGPSDVAARSAELLSCAAGLRAPRVDYSDDPAVRQNCAKAWAAWGQRNAKTVDLSHADCDLGAFNPAERARDVVRQCLSALVANDPAAFKKAADVPFHIPNQQPPSLTRDDLDRCFNDARNFGLAQGTFSILGAVPLSEYTDGQGATKPNGPMAASEEAKFAAKFKRADLAVFLVQQNQVGVPNPNPDPTQGMLFLVRLGDQPHVVGISPNRSGIKLVW